MPVNIDKDLLLFPINRAYPGSIGNPGVNFGREHLGVGTRDVSELFSVDERSFDPDSIRIVLVVWFPDKLHTLILLQLLQDVLEIVDSKRSNDTQILHESIALYVRQNRRFLEMDLPAPELGDALFVMPMNEVTPNLLQDIIYAFRPSLGAYIKRSVV